MQENDYIALRDLENFKWNLKYLIRREPLNRRILRSFRRAACAKSFVSKFVCGRIWSRLSERYGIEIDPSTKIGKGFYLGHPYGVTINPSAILGDNVCVHKGVTIGVENRGKRKGTPIIGNCVWIGINAIVYGNVKIGDDVLISPNTVVNFDVPSHSVVYGNPGIIRHKPFATLGYVSYEAVMKYGGEDNGKFADR